MKKLGITALAVFALAGCGSTQRVATGVRTVTTTAPNSAATRPVTTGPTPNHSVTGGSLLSQGLPTYSTGTAVYPVSDMVNSSYSEFRCTPPCSGTIDISSLSTAQRASDIVTWYNEDNNFNHVEDNFGGPYNLPKTFTIDVNTAAAGGAPPTTGWTTLEKVSNNTYNSGQYAVSLTGENWIRMNVTASAGSSGNTDAKWHMDITSCTSSCTAGSPIDTWLFLGDSITNNSMTLTPTSPPNFMQSVNRADPSFYPSELNGGLSGWRTSTFLGNDGGLCVNQACITDYLKQYPDAHFVTLNLGSNDIGQGVSAATFLANMKTLVRDVIKAGRVPIVPTIPWAPRVCNAPLNADNPATAGTANYDIVNVLYKAYPQIVHGPDLWAYFDHHQSLIDTSNCPHPTNPTGQNAYRALWASTMEAEIYARTERP